MVGEQPTYLNAAVVGRTNRAPHELLRELQQIEADRGRERPYAGAPRTLDLDLILYGGVMLFDVRIVVPHPRFRERRFVLEPLVEIAPDLIDPASGLTMAQLLTRIGSGPEGTATAESPLLQRGPRAPRP